MTLKPTMGAKLLKARADLALAAGVPTAGVDGTTAPALTPYLQFRLARLRLLHDMPFHYLVPDARLLPDEAIRFFTLDDAWLDALIEGALGSASNGSRELARAKKAAGSAIASSNRLRYGVRKVALGRIGFDLAVAGDQDVAPGTVSGLLIRSKIVSQWSGFGLRAWTSKALADVPIGADPARLEADHPELVVPILRMERLAPSLLLALFDGVPEMVWLEEPHGAVQFGFEGTTAGTAIDVRDEAGGETGNSVPLPLRAGAIGGVVDVAALAAALDQRRPLGQPRGSGALAVQLLRPPARQRFGG
ncbi:hypothetical protein [Sphingomonas sp.]|uniref:hypothetical protein n=1 Tax=Sphingomonas sp. TaxID=28214 RepID=UPI000DB1BD81|nr:hypothetical protein [Sphingomonas sp.]PZU10105.1 MAG: hypothetical protein DI605_05780 [Sphingomonas sp.]